MAPRTQRAAAPDTSDEDESLLVAAMANTESEIFTEAMGDDEDENDGDTSLEQMDDPVGDDEEDAGEEEGDEEGQEETGDEAPQEGAREPPPQERPSYRLPPVDPSAQRIAELEARLARMEAPRQEQPAPPPQELPDPVLDPAGFREGMAAQMRAEYQQATRTAILENNFKATEAAYSRENRRDEFTLAASQLNELSFRARTDPNAAATVRGIVNAPDPGYALMQWAEDTLDLENFRQEQAERNREQAARLLGVDPADLEGIAPQRQAPRQDTRERGEQRQAPAQRGRGTSPRLPSLNSAGGVGREGGNSRNLDPRGFDGSEESIFRDAFN
jgi:hypothetical protein